MTSAPEPKAEGKERPEGTRPDLSGRDLQENRSQGEPLEAEPGSDADQAAEVPHVG